MTLSPHAARVRRMFGEIAPRYDVLNRLMSLRTDVRWRRRAVTASLRAGDTRVLDLCCGSGDLALEYARRLAPGALVAGADFTRPMLTLFRRKLPPRAGAGPRVVLMEADSLVLPLRDSLFDVVSVAFGLRNLDDPAAGLREMARVARPGGRVVVLDFCPRLRPRLHNRLFDWTFRHVITPAAGLISGHREAYRYLPESVGRFPSREELGQHMESAGLRVAVSRDLTGGIAALVIGVKQ